MKYQTLSQYRTEHLRVSQSEIARRAKVPQGCISDIERGHRPKLSRIELFTKAYGLPETTLMRLISAARASRALQVPVSESEPLFAQAMQPNIRRLALRMMLEKTFGKAVRA